MSDRGEGEDLVHKNLYLRDLHTGVVRLLVEHDPWMSAILWPEEDRLIGSREWMSGADEPREGNSGDRLRGMGQALRAHPRP